LEAIHIYFASTNKKRISMKSVFFHCLFIFCYNLMASASNEGMVLVNTSISNLKSVSERNQTEHTPDLIRSVYVEEQDLVAQQPLSLVTQEKEINTLDTDILVLLMVCMLLTCGLLYKRQRTHRQQNRQLAQTNQSAQISQSLLQAELENRLMKEKELQRALEIKNQQLASYNMNLLQKNEMIEELRNHIEILKKTPSEQLPQQFKHIKRLLDNSLHIDKDWENFKLHFAQVHPSLFRNLKERFPDLSNNDLKVCALVKLNLNLKESAAILGIAPESVKSARYRLRKKFNLSHEDSLVDFIRRMDVEEPIVLSA
jgi:DNA-binding CsgD family transcriptional regulator